MKLMCGLGAGMCLGVLASGACTLPDVYVKPRSDAVREMGADEDAGPAVPSEGMKSGPSSSTKPQPPRADGAAGAGGTVSSQGAAGSAGSGATNAAAGGSGAMPKPGSDAAGSGATVTGFGSATKLDISSTRIRARFAADREGNWMSAWSQEIEDLEKQVWARRYDADTGWEQPTLLGEANTDLGALAMDPDGRALVLLSVLKRAGVTSSTPIGVLQSTLTARAYANGAWAPAKTLGPAFGILETQLAVNKIGNAIASWTEYDNESEEHSWTLKLARFSPSAGWGSKYEAASVSASPSQPQEVFNETANWPSRTSLAIGDADDAVIGWSKVRDDSVSAFILGGSGVQSPRPPFEPASPTLSHIPTPSVAIDAENRALVVWSSSDGTRARIRSQRWVVGIGWDADSALIDASDGGEAGAPQITMDSQGNALAIWRQTDNARKVLWSNRFEIDRGWGTAERVEPMNTTGEADLPAIAFDGAGNALAAWIAGTRIHASRYVVGKGWTPAETLSAQDAECTPPRIATSADGTALITWAEELGPSDRNYWYSVYRAQ